MKSPDETAEELRRIAASVAEDRLLDPARDGLAMLASSLRKAADPVQEFRQKGDLEGLADYLGSVTLVGPFKKDPGSSSGDLHTFEVDELVVLGDAFPKALSELSGEDLEETKWETRHEITVETEWDYTKPEPSVGWGGGHTLEGFEVVAVDGLLLENPEDRKAATARLEDEIRSQEDKWSRGQEDAAAEARAESMIDDWD